MSLSSVLLGDATISVIAIDKHDRIVFETAKAKKPIMDNTTRCGTIAPALKGIIDF